MNEAQPASLASTESAVTQNPSPVRKRSLRQIWTYRLLAMCLPLVCLGLLEIGCRLFGIGQDLSLVVKVPGHPTALPYQLNEAVDLAYYGRTTLAGPEARRFDLPKPKGTYRIVFLGASTVLGFPYTAEMSFPRQVENILQQQEPETRFEVLNVSIISMNSFALVDLTRQSLDCEPDLIVVHTGHNEFYGPGGPASSALRLPPHLVPLTYRLKRIRLVQSLVSLVSRTTPVEQDLMNLLPKSMRIPLESEVVRQAETNLETNLNQIVQICQEAGVPVLLSTVSSNIRDQSPMSPIWPDDIQGDQQLKWEGLVEQAEVKLQTFQAQDALSLLEQAAGICPRNARLLYRKAQALEMAGKPAEAREHYKQARDEDGCRFRAPSSFLKIVQQVAASHGAEVEGSSTPHQSHAAVSFLDTAGELEKIAHPAGPGHDLYLEHVHYNREGHQHLARIFAEDIQTRIRQQAWDPERVPSPEELDELNGATPEDDLAAWSFSLEVLKTGALRSAIDHERQKEFVSQAVSSRIKRLSPVRIEAFADLPMNVLSSEIALPLADLHLARGNLELAEKFASYAINRRPWQPAAWLYHARVQYKLGHRDAATSSIQRCLQLQPDWEVAVAFADALFATP